MSLAALVKASREAALDPLTGRPYTQAGLAKAVGVSRATIAAIEAGNVVTLSPDTANRMSRLLRVSVEALLRQTGYDVGTPELSAVEADLVALYRRVPEPFRPGFVASMRGLARELAELPPPQAKQAPRRAG